MGAAAATAGAATSVASSLIQGASTQRQYAAEASRLRVAASTARLRASETGLQYQQQINEAENSLLTTRAAKNVSVDSPTGIALEGFVRDRLGFQRGLAVSDQMMQADGLDDQAQMARSAGKAALLSSYVGAAGAVTRGAFGVATSPSLTTGVSSLASTLSPLRNFFAADDATAADPRVGFASPSQRA